MGLQEYKEVVGQSALICTMAHMLSGTLVCRNIYKKGSSEGFDVKPFAGGIGMGILMLQYALLLNDPLMININIFGLSTSIAYVTIFYIYASNKSEIIGTVGKVVGIAALFLMYAKFENPDKIVFRFGLITTVLLFLLICAPMMNIGHVIRTKSTEILPFPLIAMGTIVSSHWFLYGIIIDNSIIIFQNIIGLLLHVLQLSLFAIFPSKPKISINPDDNKEK